MKVHLIKSLKAKLNTEIVIKRYVKELLNVLF